MRDHRVQHLTSHINSCHLTGLSPLLGVTEEDSTVIREVLRWLPARPDAKQIRETVDAVLSGRVPRSPVLVSVPQLPPRKDLQ